MTYKITDKRKKEIVNVIAEITAKLKKFDEVECITWNSEKDETIITNIIDRISGNGYGDPITITGNILAICVITAEPKPSSELRETINKIKNDYVNSKTYKQTGVDIFIQTLPRYNFCMYSDEDKKNISKLYTMQFENNIDREAVIKFLNEEVFKGSKTIPNYSETVSDNYYRMLIGRARDMVYQYSDWPRLLYRDKIIYDKTPDNYYTRVFNQFEGYKDYYARETNPPKQLYSLNLNLDIEEALKLRLEKEQ